MVRKYEEKKKEKVEDMLKIFTCARGRYKDDVINERELQRRKVLYLFASL
jgi:hypothetical protein